MHHRASGWGRYSSTCSIKGALMAWKPSRMAVVQSMAACLGVSLTRLRFLLGIPPGCYHVLGLLLLILLIPCLFDVHVLDSTQPKGTRSLVMFPMIV